MVDQDIAIYQKIDRLIPMLEVAQFSEAEGVEELLQKFEDSSEIEGDFFIDEKNRQIELTEQGHRKVEEYLESIDLLKAGRVFMLRQMYIYCNMYWLH